MRLRLVAPCFALLITAFGSTSLHAQFQAPTPDELKMTEDPKAPGASAVYLYREETTDDHLRFHSYYERIKVLTEKGKEMATIRIPYEHGSFKVTDIHGRTIHADGTIIPLVAKPADLVDVKTAGYQRNTVVFTLPSVEVGSILEYRLQLRYDDGIVLPPTWEVQQPYFVHKAHYYFQPSNSGGVMDSHGNFADRLMYSLQADGNAKVIHDAQNRYMFDITDVPALPNEDWMPPINTLKWRVEFYYTPYTTGAEFWQAEGKRWAKDAEHFTNPTKAIQQAAAQLVAPGDTEEQKARKLYDAVQKLDNTSFTREKSAAERKNEKLKQIKDAEDVWNQKSGSADDIALLYIALARAAGLQAFPMQVVNRNRAIFDVNYLTTWQLDDYIAILTIGGKEVLLDPGQKQCPFGILQWKHSMAGGVRLTPKGPTFVSTNPSTYLQSQLGRIADLTLDTDGSVTGNVRFVMTGQQALRWRQLTLQNDEDEVKKQFNEFVRNYVPDGIQADFDHFLGLEDSHINLVAIVKVSGNMGTATGKRFFLPGLFFESHARHPFVAADKRSIPVDVLYAELQKDDVTYHLPAGFALDSAPQAANLSWPDHAMFKINSTSTPNTVNITRTFAYNYTLLPASDYSSLHDFFQKIATADQQQLVLTRAPVVTIKGN
jgi:hypothetical protein